MVLRAVSLFGKKRKGPTISFMPPVASGARGGERGRGGRRTQEEDVGGGDGKERSRFLFFLALAEWWDIHTALTAMLETNGSGRPEIGGNLGKETAWADREKIKTATKSNRKTR